MAINIIFNFLYPFIDEWLDKIPTIDLTFTGNYFETFIGYINLVTYIFPIGRLFPILQIIIALTLFRIVTSLIKLVWNLLPIV